MCCLCLWITQKCGYVDTRCHHGNVHDPVDEPHASTTEHITESSESALRADRKEHEKQQKHQTRQDERDLDVVGQSKRAAGLEL